MARLVSPFRGGAGRGLAQAWLFHARERRREHQNESTLASLIATPHDLGVEPLVMPANGRLAVSHSAGVAAGELSVIVNGTKTLSTPALAANEIHRLDLVEVARSVEVDCLVPGTVTVYLVDHWGVHKPIATLLVAETGLLIHDEFNGAAATEINGRTPDTLNTPGNNWVTEANSLWQLNGSGAAVPVSQAVQVLNPGMQINSGVTDNLQKAEVEWSTPGGGNNLRCRVFILGDGAWNAGANNDPNDMLYFSRDNTGCSLNETIGGTNTVLASSVEAAAVRTGDIRRIQNDAGTIRCFEGAGELTALATVYSVPAGLTGNPFMGLFYAGNFSLPSPYGYFKGYDNGL